MVASVGIGIKDMCMNHTVMPTGLNFLVARTRQNWLYFILLKALMPQLDFMISSCQTQIYIYELNNLSLDVVVGHVLSLCCNLSDYFSPSHMVCKAVVRGACVKYLIPSLR